MKAWEGSFYLQLKLLPTVQTVPDSIYFMTQFSSLSDSIELSPFYARFSHHSPLTAALSWVKSGACSS